jgi:beta-mannanase
MRRVVPRTFPLLLALVMGAGVAADDPATASAAGADAGTSPSAIFLPILSRYRAPDDYIGIAFDARSLQTYAQDLADAQEWTGVHFAYVHLPVVWSDLEFADIQRLFDIIVDNGSTPFIVWEPWAGMNAGVGPDRCQQDYRLQRILDGHFNPFIGRFARGAAEWGHVFLMDFGHEMNINQAAWSGWCNGGPRGGPEQFQRAYRYLHDRFVEQAATNVRWVWTPNFQSLPLEPWNDPERYYPGDAYVDWIGTNAFNWGASSRYTEHRFRSFEDIVGPILDRMALLHPTRPQIVIEAGSVDGDGGSRAAWVAGALESIARRPQVHAVIYYSYDHPRYLDGRAYDFRLDGDPAARTALRDGVARLGFGQRLYEGRDGVPPRRLMGTGASLGVGVSDAPDLPAFYSRIGLRHPVVVFFAHWRQSGYAYADMFGHYMGTTHVPLVIWDPVDTTPADIAAGKHDNYLTQWAQAMRQYDQTVYLAWGIEPNNSLSGRPWSGAANGGARGGPEAYVAAWRHIHDHFARYGASKVRWVWMPAYADIMPADWTAMRPAWNRPLPEWNHFTRYYPGDAYVDWIGLLAVNEGNNLERTTYWIPARTFFERILGLSAQLYPSKPQMVILTSVEDEYDVTRKAAWITDAYTRLAYHRNVRAVAWIDAFQPAWAFDSSVHAATAYRQAVRSPYFRSTVP